MLHWSQDASTGWTRNSWLGSMATMRSPRSYLQLPELESAEAARRPRRPRPGGSTGRNLHDDGPERTHGTTWQSGGPRSDGHATGAGHARPAGAAPPASTLARRLDGRLTRPPGSD